VSELTNEDELSHSLNRCLINSVCTFYREDRCSLPYTPTHCFLGHSWRINTFMSCRLHIIVLLILDCVDGWLYWKKLSIRNAF